MVERGGVGKEKCGHLAKHRQEFEDGYMERFPN